MSKIKVPRIPVTLVKNVKCTHPHYCYEWDSLFITPIMQEFEACVCQCNGEEYTDKDWKKFYKDMKDDGFGNKQNLKEYLIHIGKGELAMT